MGAGEEFPHQSIDGIAGAWSSWQTMPSAIVRKSLLAALPVTEARLCDCLPAELAHRRRLKRVGQTHTVPPEAITEPHTQVAVAGDRCCFRIPPFDKLRAAHFPSKGPQACWRLLGLRSVSLGPRWTAPQGRTYAPLDGVRQANR